MRRHAVLAGLLLSGLLTTVGATPAYAETLPPEITELDWQTTPGHVTGTVTSGTDVPFVLVDLGMNGTWPGPQTMVQMTFLDEDTNTGTFDLETWGLGSPVGADPQLQVGASNCTGSDPTTCEPVQTVSGPFQPTDVRPHVAWPDDTTIGPGQDVVVHVDDPEGGGDLRATWTGTDAVDTVLERNGTTIVSVDDGSGVLVVRRCMAGSQFYCDDFDPPLQVPLEVHRGPMGVDVTGLEPTTVGPAFPDTTAYLDAERQGHYSFAWGLYQDDQAVYTSPVPDVGETGTDGTFSLRLDHEALGLGSGWYHLGGTLTVTDPDFGEYTTAFIDGPPFQVDLDPPTVTTFTSSRAVVRPLADAPYDTTMIRAEGEPVDDVAGFVVRDAGNAVVRRLVALPGAGAWTAAFDGRDDQAEVLPAGSYTIRLADSLGNVSASSVAVKVSHQSERVLTTYTRRITAAGSTYTQFVGRCSRLRQPSYRDWPMSLGYYANARCDDYRWEVSGIWTKHRVRVPAVESPRDYVDLRVTTHGGAARRVPTSTAEIRYIRNTSETDYVATRTLSRRLAAHPGYLRPARALVDANRYVRWRVATGFGNWYDVKSFTVVIRYYVWQ